MKLLDGQKNSANDPISPSILIMAGGTGGHVFPALAVAEALKKAGWTVHWLGTKAGLEAHIVARSGFPLHYISIQGLRKKNLLTRVVAPFQIGIAVCQALKVLHAIKPRVVLGMGGFVAGPGGIAAWLMRLPLLIHEQNAIAGLTNRFLALLATRILEGFPKTFNARLKAVYTGNPVRLDLLGLRSPSERFKTREKPRRLLVLGGSRGAVALNRICSEAIQKIPVEERPEIWHQTGVEHLQMTQDCYQRSGVRARIEPFIEDMASAYSWADLVLCRSGALTIAELAAVGLGSILVPYPHAVDDHQTQNGRFLEKAGAARLIPQSRLTAERLADILLNVLTHPSRLLEMANAAHRLAHRSALDEVQAQCEEIGNRAFTKP